MNAAVFDFAVVGGGPAGLAACTLLAAGGARVLLVDAAKAAGFKAGEFIQPKVKSFLGQLAILPDGWAGVHLPVHGFVNGWASNAPQETDFIFDPNGHALSLDRRLFEEQLLAAARNRGVETRLGWTARDIQQAGNSGWRLFLQTGNDTVRCDARYLVLATGRSNIPLLRIDRRKFDRLTFVAVRLPIPVADTRPFIECFDRGWVYATPVPGNAWIIYVFFDIQLGLPFRRSLGSLREELKDCSRLSKFLDEIPEGQSDKLEWFSGTAHSGLADKTIGPDWCLLGDLAESRDPLSASGIFSSVRDASRMAECLLSGRLADKAHQERDAERAQLFADYLSNRHRYYAEETRWSGLPFWSGKGGFVGDSP
ncbi:NAD(P)-binding protein [Bradyrhizobium sp. JYMT SZCCT0428]|uniref:NAD(P)/FAD-dependent oxidoreductase n=1 Tax=Bradyrhizobium sp. JYMT SZCCT0428 TaxID=2807673 RepID=UPI001BA5D487|nr:NAD(P)-binding protein [Bradyrhizobium sp. JYMT SZCCT0428]MBR1154272.1 NAD(P)-binding protein [Bradyrhizobium sp. JYMT SZCCT0428]